MNTDKNYLKVTFKLKIDEDGYPPVGFESVWLKKKNGLYVLDNIPTYVYGVSKLDEISFHDEHGELIVDGVRKKNGNSTLRAYVFDSTHLNDILIKIQEMGAFTASSKNSTYFSIDIPHNISFELIDGYLSELSDNNILDYEDACLQHPSIDPQRRCECEQLSALYCYFI